MIIVTYTASNWSLSFEVLLVTYNKRIRYNKRIDILNNAEESYYFGLCRKLYDLW